MSDYFSDKVALVTGAAVGMGFAGAQAFAEAGACVVLSDVNEDTGQEAAESLRAKGYEVTFVRCDVTKEAEVAALVDAAVAKYGRLDAAFNNAGVIDEPTELPEVSDDEYNRVMSINLRGVWNSMKYELIQMRKQGSGAIVNNSSIGGLIGNPGRSVYHATKHAVLGITKCTALDYAAKGIRINAVCPGTIDTPMVQELLRREGLTAEFFVDKAPIGRLGRPEEVAAAVVWLCSPGASMVIGHGLPVDGGYTIQ
jgi:NAD(P)-dependent dehydrogenase (short-subunit alcohol dehydrogenase family)